MTNKTNQTPVKSWAFDQFQRAKAERSVTQSDLGKALGISQPQARSLISGPRKISAEEIPLLEKFFGSMFVYQSRGGTIAVPLLSWVSAGAVAETANVSDSFDDVPYTYTSDLDPSGDWIALRVDGRSMDKISPHDSIVFVNRKEKTLVPNGCYIISDGNGGATYKRYRPPNKFEPVSTKAEQFETIEFEEGREPEIIGRVRRTILAL